MLRILPACMLAFATLLWGQQESLTPVTQEEVWQVVAAYLRAAGIEEQEIPAAEDLEFPGTILARKSRTLRVAGLCWEDRMERVAFRLECTRGGGCLPFLVYGGIKQLHASGKIEIAATCSRQAGTPAAKTVHKEIVVRAGDRATVMFRGDQLQVSVPVTCVERGAEGEIIRVRNADGVLFRARVLGTALLEALANEE